MSAQDYMAGFQIAGGKNANNIIDLTADAKAVAKHQLAEDKITYDRQKAFDDARAQFKKDMADQYDQYVYENNFDETGILDFDSATAKLRNTIKSSHLETEYLYNQGIIDEAEVRRRNNSIKGQVNEVQNLSQDITAYTDKVKELEEAGKGSEINGIRTTLLEALNENFNIASNSEGLQFQTIIDGKPVGMNAGKFKQLLNAEQGVDIEKDLDEIVKLGGFEEKLEGWGRNAKKVTSYLRDSEEGKALLNTRIDGWSASEKYDYMLKAGLATDDPELAEKEGLKLITAKNIFDKEVSEDEEDLIADHMAKELTNRLLYKEKKELYDDKFALEYTKQKNRKELKAEKPKVKMADVTQTDADSGDKQRLRTYTPTDGEGIEMSYLIADPGSNMSKQFFASVEGSVNGIPIPAEAIKKAVYKQERIDLDTGVIEIDMGYDYDVEETQRTALIDQLMSMSPSERNSKLNSMEGFSESGISPSDDQAVARFLGEMAPKKGSGVFKYVPTDINDYNKIITATGRDPISTADWTEYIKNKRARAKREGTTFASKNK